MERSRFVTVLIELVMSKNKKRDCLKSQFLWSCRDSNPGPNTFAVSLLHVYFCIICRENAGAKQTNIFLSWIFLSDGHSLPSQQPVLFLSRRKSVATGLARSTARMEANLSITQPWQNCYCHLEFSYSD